MKLQKADLAPAAALVAIAGVLYGIATEPAEPAGGATSASPHVASASSHPRGKYPQTPSSSKAGMAVTDEAADTTTPAFRSHRP